MYIVVLHISQYLVNNVFCQFILIELDYDASGRVKHGLAFCVADAVPYNCVQKYEKEYEKRLTFFMLFVKLLDLFVNKIREPL